MERVRLVATVLFVAILTSCSPGNGAAPLMSDAKAPERVVARTGAADHLYVGVCGSCDRGKIDEINVYPAGSVTAAHTIRTGIYNPSSMTMDRTGDLYVVNEALVNSSIAVYPPGATTPSLTIAITIPQPTGLTVDNSKNVFIVSTPANEVLEYAAGTATILRTIPVLFPSTAALDAAGNLYVAANQYNNHPTGRVYEFAPGKTKPSRTIHAGIGSNPRALAFDRLGNLYVANCNSCRGSSKPDTIVVFAPGKATPMRVVNPPKGASAVAFDNNDNLYVIALYDSIVTGYTHGSMALKRSITSGVRQPVALAFDARGELYVENSDANGYFNVTQYDPGSTAVRRTIKSHWNLGGMITGP